MNFPFRRKPLVQILCCAGIIAGGYAVESQAQSQAPATLRVDPVLLGLPPIKPSEAPAPARPPVAAPAAVDKGSAEVKPVEAAVVEVRPVDSASETEAANRPSGVKKTSADKSPSEKERPQAKPVARVPAPDRQPAGAVPPAAVVPPRSPRDDERQAVSSRQVSPSPEQPPLQPPARVSQQYPVAKGGATTSTLEPLRVDPVLLGLPPIKPAETTLARPAVPASGENARAEVRPVEPSRVEARPLGSASASPENSARTAPLPAAQAPVSAQASRQVAQISPATRSNSSVTSLPPLRVDPALLGLPAVTVPSTLASSSETMPPQVAATGPRDEEEVPDPTPSVMLRASRAMVPPPKDSTVPRPVFLSAYRMNGQVEREFNAEGDAELRKIGTVVNADRLTYWPIDNEVEAEGSVRLEQGLDVVSGPKMRLNLDDQTGFFDQPEYTLQRQPQVGSKAASDKAFALQFLSTQEAGDLWNSGFAAPRTVNAKSGQATFRDPDSPARTMIEGRGTADRIDFEGDNQVRISRGTYTTCSPGNNDWYIKADEFKLDYDFEVGEGKDGVVYFKEVPIFYSPWLSFSLNNQRKSGLLAPNFGSSSDSGLELTLPYYWNIAPNMDATIAPRLISKRGVQLNNEFRYLNSAYGGLYKGEMHFETLPGDKLKDGDSRYGFSLRHTQKTANGFTGQINYNKVSDDDYFTDLSSDISKTSQTQLLQQGKISYGGGWWNATANFQQYQTLQPDAKNPVREQYRLLPQITINARKPDLYSTDSSFLGQYSNFSIANRIQSCKDDTSKSCVYPDGQRFVLYPQLALPYITPGWYVTPKIGVNIRHYSLTGQMAGVADSISSTVPIFSVDSGMTFERSSNWFGRDYTQTLEPRLFYLNIPYRNQEDIPIFDTTLADFNFAQIFSENQFTGWDRINNANQLTAAVTSRLLEPSTGNEIMRAMFGQRFNFTRNKVALSGTTDDDSKWEKSDLLAAFSGQILPKVYADAAWQYSPFDRQVERYSLGGRYQPEPGKVLNMSYRYIRDTSTPVNQVDISGQWPITGRWYGVGRANYSLKDETSTSSSQGGRLIEAIAGLEYNGGCWVARAVVRRQALTQDNASTSFFIQLELNDFARIGSNPISILKRSIQGYDLINQPGSDSDFGE